MLRVKRFSKVTDKVKEIGKSIEHTVTHPKETGKKVVEYVKKHPDEAIILEHLILFLELLLPN